MLIGLAPYIGAAAALLASFSYLPQVRKAWPRGATKDLSLGMLATLTMGLALWVAYGALRHDGVIVLANAVGGSLSGIVLGCKIRDIAAQSAKRGRTKLRLVEQPSPRRADARG